jgi:hypothetical protein
MSFINNNFNNHVSNSANINTEKISLELSLNTIGLNHTLFNRMSKQEFFDLYQEKIKYKNNINIKLSLDILLKYKMNNTNTYQDTYINSNNSNINNINKNISTYSTQKIKNNNIINANTLPEVINTNAHNQISGEFHNNAIK